MGTSSQGFWTRVLCCRGYGVMGAVTTLFVTSAQAAGLPPPPVQTWTGFSVGVGGGVEFFNADVNAKASRTDTVGECESQPITNPPSLDPFLNAPCDPSYTEFPPKDLFSAKQSLTSNLNDLGETGGFFTVRGAYDYQFAPRWVAGTFVDGDWSDVSASASQTQTSSSPGPQIADREYVFTTGQKLAETDSESWCDVQVIDLDTGACVHWFRIDGPVAELYDLGVVPGVVRPMALGFATDEMLGLITHDPLTAHRGELVPLPRST
jgi:hypothetical protein